MPPLWQRDIAQLKALVWETFSIWHSSKKVSTPEHSALAELSCTVAQGTVCSKQAQHNGDFPVIKSETYIKKIVKPCTQKRSMWEVRSRVKIRKVVSIMVFWKKGNLLLGLSDLYWNNLFLEIALCPKIRLFWPFEFVVWRKNYEPDAFKVHILWKGHKIVKKYPNFFSVCEIVSTVHSVSFSLNLSHSPARKETN